MMLMTMLSMHRVSKHACGTVVEQQGAWRLYPGFDATKCRLAGWSLTKMALSALGKKVRQSRSSCQNAARLVFCRISTGSEELQDEPRRKRHAPAGCRRRRRVTIDGVRHELPVL